MSAAGAPGRLRRPGARAAASARAPMSMHATAAARRSGARRWAVLWRMCVTLLLGWCVQ